MILGKYRSNGLVLGYCVSAAQQVYIVTQRAPLLSPLSGSPIDQYVYVLEASHSSVDAQQHNALLDPHPEADNALAAVGTPVNAGPGVASVNEWSAIG